MTKKDILITVAAWLWLLAVAMTVLFADDASAALRITPIGDSITSGFQDTSGTGSYRYWLERQFLLSELDYDYFGTLSYGPPMIDKDHEGHSGWTIEQLAAFPHQDTDVALVLAGTNNWWNEVNVQVHAAKYSSLFQAIHAASNPLTRIVASTLPKTADTTPNADYINNVRLPALNEGLRIAAALHNVQVVDYFTIFDNDTMLWDNWHPNNLGHKVLAKLFWEAIVGKQVLEQNDPVPEPKLSSILIWVLFFAAVLYEADEIFQHPVQ